MDEITSEIAALTIRVWLYRHVRRECRMPIKWNIAAKAMKARGIMDQISAEYDGLIDVGSEHLADVKGIRSQAVDMRDDLQSAANVMGNASGVGAEPVQPVKLPPATFTSDPPKTIVAPPGLVDTEPGMVTFKPLPNLPTPQQMAFGRDVADPRPSQPQGSAASTEPA